MFVIMNLAMVMNMPGIGTVGLRVVHNAQDARNSLSRPQPARTTRAR